MFTPTWVGTYPLGLQIPGSDLDIVCSAPDLGHFERALHRALGELHLRATTQRVQLDPEASVTALTLDGIAVELFCQTLPVTAQRGFRHMIVEGRLLTIGGEALRARIVALKSAGLKTEPAFACVLELPGDAYEAVLALEAWTHEALAARVSEALAGTQ